MLHEEHRPKTFSAFIGNRPVVARLEAVLKRAVSKDASCAVWIDGPSGVGKTTLAKIAAIHLNANDCFDVVELDGPDCDGRAVTALEDTLRLKAWGGGYRVVIVNEAHNMTAKGVQLWLTLLERLPSKCAIFFTTTEGRLGGSMFGSADAPLKSRCVCLHLETDGLDDAFAAQAQMIAESEGLGGATAAEYLNLVARHGYNMRAVISQIEALEMFREPADQAA